jgi:hypothetical protein
MSFSGANVTLANRSDTRAASFSLPSGFGGDVGGGGAAGAGKGGNNVTEVDSTIVQFSRNPFAALNPAPVDSVISSVTLRVAGEEEEMKVRNLTRPIELLIPITDPDPWRELSRFNCSGDDAAMCAERNLAVIARLLQPSCFYWDDTARNWTTEGCNFTGFRDDFSVGVCECSHLTSFMARFATTVEKARVVLSVAKGLNLETLKKNLGESLVLISRLWFVGLFC